MTTAEAECFIDDDSNQFSTTCQAFMASQTPGSSSCPTDVVFRYVIENVGNVCKDITSVTVTEYYALFAELTADPFGNEPYFCPGDLANFLITRQVNLCELFGGFLEFELIVNEGISTDAFIEFPEANDLTLTPIPER